MVPSPPVIPLLGIQLRAAGVAVQRIVQREKLVEKVAAEGPLLRELLVRAMENSGSRRYSRPRFLPAVELVKDPETRAFPADLQVHLRVRRALTRGDLLSGQRERRRQVRDP